MENYELETALRWMEERVAHWRSRALIAESRLESARKTEADAIAERDELAERNAEMGADLREMEAGMRTLRDENAKLRDEARELCRRTAGAVIAAKGVE